MGSIFLGNMKPRKQEEAPSGMVAETRDRTPPWGGI